MLSFLGKALGVVAEVVGITDGGSAVQKIRDVIAGDPELQRKLADQETEFRRLAIQEGESIRELYGIEVASESKFVKFARPGMLWLVFSIIAANFVLIPIINAVSLAFGGGAIVVTFPELPESVQLLIGSIFAVYTGARSYDKSKKNGVR